MNTSNPVTKILALIVGVILTAGVGVWGYTQYKASSNTAGTNISNAMNQAGNSANYGSGSQFGSGNLTTSGS